MASNLTGQVRNIAEVTIAVANGDLSRKITVDVRGEILQLKEAINAMVEQLRSFSSEVTRVAREVGTEGRLGVQAVVPGVGRHVERPHRLGQHHGRQPDRAGAQHRGGHPPAVARGDLTRKITVDVKGEILELKNTINTMVDQLRSFAAEVTRVAREVGTAGKLGGQAEVPGVAGTWKDLTDNVNFMASNLTDQVRGIVKVVTAVANGNLRQKLTVEAKGEVAALAETINNMTDTLATFAEQVTNVGARSRRRRAPRRPGERARRGRHLEGPHRERESARREPHQPGARHRGGRHGGHQRRPDPIDSGRSTRRSVGAEGQHQHDDRQPARDDRSQPGAGLAEDQPREVHPACSRASAIWSPSASCCSPNWRRSSARSRARSTRR